MGHRTAHLETRGLLCSFMYISELETAWDENACACVCVSASVHTICAQPLESWSPKMENIISKSPMGKNISMCVSVHQCVLISISSMSVSLSVSCSILSLFILTHNRDICIMQNEIFFFTLLRVTSIGSHNYFHRCSPYNRCIDPCLA